jgi:hypothetical protein
VFKRVIWFAAGAAAGIAGMRRVEREVAERRARLEPDALAHTAVEAAGRGADRVRSAVADGRREMQRVARELEASHEPSRRPARTRELRPPGIGSTAPTSTR